MELGDRVRVSQQRHPFYNYTGVVVGKRGQRVPGDLMLLVLLNNRSYLIPESMLVLEEEEQDNTKK